MPTNVSRDNYGGFTADVFAYNDATPAARFDEENWFIREKSL